MPILPSDNKLLESERMRDTPDGGGRMTGNVIVSGEMSNVFPKVSRSDAVYGRVNFRKIYLAVKTATLEMYAGAMTVVMKPPGNDLISVAVFAPTRFSTAAPRRAIGLSPTWCKARSRGCASMGTS